MPETKEPRPRRKLDAARLMRDVFVICLCVLMIGYTIKTVAGWLGL